MPRILIPLEIGRGQKTETINYIYKTATAISNGTHIEILTFFCYSCPMYNPFAFSPLINILLVLIIIWTIVWKVYAVWTAVKHNHKKWFVALIILNTFAILEIFYIFKIAKKSWSEVKGDFRHGWESFKK